MSNCNCNNCETCQKTLSRIGSEPEKNKTLTKTPFEFDNGNQLRCITSSEDDEDYDDDPSDLFKSGKELPSSPFNKNKFKKKNRIQDNLDSIPESMSKENMAAMLEKLEREEREKKKKGI